jgi:hypothetical protein
MANTTKLGEGYYGIETERKAINPIVFEQISNAFQLAYFVAQKNAAAQQSEQQTCATASASSIPFSQL